MFQEAGLGEGAIWNQMMMGAHKSVTPTPNHEDEAALWNQMMKGAHDVAEARREQGIGMWV